MNAGEIVYGALTAEAAVAALAGNRVLPVEVGQEIELPAVAYVVQLGECIDGSAPLQRIAVTAYALAHTEGEAHALATAVDGALEGLARRYGDTTLGPLSRTQRQPDYNQEFNLWSWTLGYEGWISF